jgi:uncharacterized protein (DUF305 family)
MQARLIAAGIAFVLTTSPAAQHSSHGNEKPTGDSAWIELTSSMEDMHRAMGSVAASGNSDVDFVRLMLPHHQAAVDMARTQLLYGKDPQMRRLAQEIITDQQSEIDLMRLWLKQRGVGESGPSADSSPEKER